MVRKYFQLVHADGVAWGSAASVSIDVDDVELFRDAVKARCAIKLASVDANDLVVFANKAAFDADEAPLKLNASLANLGNGVDDPDKDPLIVALLRPRQVVAPGTVMWTTVSDPCPQLIVAEQDKLIRLTALHVVGTGIARDDQDIVLYRRPALVAQWNEINRCSIQAYARLWILGPPGTGKSCAALAFACSLDRSQWDVIWIHYDRHSATFQCVWLHGDEKLICVVNEETVKRELAEILGTTSTTRKTIVFLDGYVDDIPAGASARRTCIRWSEQDAVKHRLVCVCSMLTIGKFYHPETCLYIPRQVDRARPVKTMMLFQLTSWRLEEYQEAVALDAFFLSVKDMFPSYQQQEGEAKELTERLNLLQAKYFVAGGSARLMFGLTTEDAIEALDLAKDRLPSAKGYIQLSIGDKSDGVVNRLLARYEIGGQKQVRLVSDYVVRDLAIKMGPRLLKNFAKECQVNPSVDGFLLETWCIVELSCNGLSWWPSSGTQERHFWDQASVYYFNPDKREIPVSEPTWMAPIHWNQGGYDAIFVDPSAQLVRFIQVTRAQHHSFDASFFIAVLNRLVAGGMAAVATVELYFVVPMERLDTFKPPVSEPDFQRNVVQVAASERRSTRANPDQTFRNCAAIVEVVGVDYDISKHQPVCRRRSSPQEEAQVCESISLSSQTRELRAVHSIEYLSPLYVDRLGSFSFGYGEEDLHAL